MSIAKPIYTRNKHLGGYEMNLAKNIERIQNSAVDIVEKSRVHKGVQYQPGFEDGIDEIKLNTLVDVDGKLHHKWKKIVTSFYGEDVANDLTATVQLPYVMNTEGKRFFNKTDYFVIENNRMYIVPEDIFVNEYIELLDEECFNGEENHIIDLKKVDISGYTMDMDDVITQAMHTHSMLGYNPSRKVVAVLPMEDMEPGQESSEIRKIYSIIGIGGFGHNSDEPLALVLGEPKLIPKEDIPQNGLELDKEMVEYMGCKEFESISKFEEFIGNILVEGLVEGLNITKQENPKGGIPSKK